MLAAVRYPCWVGLAVGGKACYGESHCDHHLAVQSVTGQRDASGGHGHWAWPLGMAPCVGHHECHRMLCSVTVEDLRVNDDRKEAHKNKILKYTRT